MLCNTGRLTEIPRNFPPETQEITITQQNIGNLNLWFVDDDTEQLNFPEDYFLVQEKFLSLVTDCTEKPAYNLIRNSM